MTLRLIDLDTPRPNNHRGDPTRTANAITNENMQEIGQRLGGLENGTPAVDARLDDLDDAVVGLGASIAQEAEARSAGDSQLQHAISAAVDGMGLALQHRYGRNRLINGDLRIWQRRKSGRVGVGAGTLGQEAFCADRFTFSALSCTHDVAQGIVGSGATTLPPQTGFAIIHTVSGATGSSFAWGGQRIEGVRSLQGQVTFSVQLNGTVGNKVGIRVIQTFGTGGSPSADVAIEAAVFTCTANPTRAKVTFTLPSTAGKTLGTNNNDFIYFVYDMCGTGYGGQLAGQNGQYAFSDFQFEAGPEATAFEWRPYGLELLLCQRYFEKSYDTNVYAGAASAFGRLGEFLGVDRTRANAYAIIFKVSKRSTPSIAIYASENGVANSFSEDNGVAKAITSVSAIGNNGLQVTYVNSTGRYGGSFHYTADAEF